MNAFETFFKNNNEKGCNTKKESSEKKEKTRNKIGYPSCQLLSNANSSILQKS
jgi:hypothetical protein